MKFKLFLKLLTPEEFFYEAVCSINLNTVLHTFDSFYLTRNISMLYKKKAINQFKLFNTYSSFQVIGHRNFCNH